MRLPLIIMLNCEKPRTNGDNMIFSSYVVYIVAEGVVRHQFCFPVECTDVTLAPLMKAAVKSA